MNEITSLHEAFLRLTVTITVSTYQMSSDKYKKKNLTEMNLRLILINRLSSKSHIIYDDSGELFTGVKYHVTKLRESASTFI